MALLILFLFLHVNYAKEMTLSQKLRRIDWVGNGLLMTGTVSTLYALTVAGSTFAWSSWQALVPLMVGFVLFACFVAWEIYGTAESQLIPLRLLRHRTSIIVAINTFLHSMLLYWALYFLPLFFEAVLLFSAAHTGVSMLPISLFCIPGAALSAIAVSRWGKFKALHLTGFALFGLGMGLFTLQKETTPTAQWVIFQSISAFGAGIVLDTLLPAFQAPVEESDQAAATATWSFIKTFGCVWGVAIPAVIFNNRVSQLAYTISDSVARQSLLEGGAYQHASRDFINSFSEPVRGEIKAIYQRSLYLVFATSVAFAGIAFVLTMMETDLPLRKELDTEYGLQDPKQKSRKDKRNEEDAARQGATETENV